MIFPKPKKEEILSGRYTLKGKYAGALYEFCKELKEDGADIKYNKNASFEKEEYKIEIGDSGIYIEYSSDEGKFRALTSLYQLSDGSSVPYCLIYDNPAFSRRGYMLDISRGRIPKKEKILRIIDFLCALKYNEFQLYMENFCFKYSAFPEFTAGFDCLTPENIKEIEKYCEDRFIELVPCQNGFGHMRSWLDTDEFKKLEITDGKEKTDTLDPENPKSAELIDRIYSSLFPLFKSKKANIGFDEAMGLGKFQNEKACAERGRENVFCDYLLKISALAKKYGKDIMIWGDMIINNPECFKRLPENTTVLEWGYDLIFSSMMEEHCRVLAEHNIPFYTCPSVMNFYSFTGRFDVMSFNMRTAAELGEKYGAKGYLVTDWGDGGHMANFVWSVVPAALGGQYGWNTGIKQHGGWLKPEFIHAAENYADKYVFKAEISRLLYMCGNLYLMEPERIHGQTICSMMLKKPLCDMDYSPFFNLEEIGDSYYFNNIINAQAALIRRIEQSDASEKLKREITVNAKMNILGAEYAIVKINAAVSEEKADELCKLSDFIIKEHTEIWLWDNFEEGIGQGINYIKSRKEELKNYVGRK